MKVVLASKSPRRKELLHLLFEDFEIRVSDADEHTEFSGPGEYVEKLAHKKAMAVEKKDYELLIGAVTILFAEGRILGKPSSREDAAEMIRSLSGKKHSVYTGVSLSYQGREMLFHEKTDVFFRDIDEDEISRYLDVASYMDKAGAYAIQEHAVRFIEKIEGDYNNVVGLPVFRIAERLKEYGISV